MGILRIVFLLLAITVNSYATDWFVSQSGSGAANGTSSENAWAKTGVVWNSIQPGDTLYIVGPIYSNNWESGKSGSESSYITIAGYDSNSGIVMTAQHVNTGFSEPDEYGVYSISTAPYTEVDSQAKGATEWVTAEGPFGWSKLTLETTLPDETWAAGSYFIAEGVFYWKPFGGSISNKTISICYNWSYHIKHEWVKYYNLKFFGGRVFCGHQGTGSENVWLDNVTVDGLGSGILINIYSDYFRLSNSSVYHGNSGLWSGLCVANNVTIDRNRFYDFTEVGGDAHCIGTYGAVNNWVVEFNDLSYANTGLTFWAYPEEPLCLSNNNIIRHNYIHNMEGSRGDGRGYGIGWESNISDPSRRTGNAVYGNLIKDCTGFGINLHFVSPLNYIFNNTIINCDVSIKSSTNGTGVSMGGEVKNNISISPIKYHIEIGNAGEGTYSDLAFNNNIYYPDGAAAFYSVSIGSPYTTNFAGWKTHLGTLGLTAADANSVVTDPDPNTNGTLKTTSTNAINTGANLGEAYKYALMSQSVWPSAVVLADQNGHGAGWEIGAFLWQESWAFSIGVGTQTFTPATLGPHTLTLQ